MSFPKELMDKRDDFASKGKGLFERADLAFGFNYGAESLKEYVLELLRSDETNNSPLESKFTKLEMATWLEEHLK